MAKPITLLAWLLASAAVCTGRAFEVRGAERERLNQAGLAGGLCRLRGSPVAVTCSRRLPLLIWAQPCVRRGHSLRSSGVDGDSKWGKSGCRSDTQSKEGRWQEQGESASSGESRGDPRRGRIRASRWTVRRPGESEARVVVTRTQASGRTESQFFLRLQRLRDMAAALDLHALHQQSREANSLRVFETLAHVTSSCAKHGTCCAADLEELLSRTKACDAPLRRPFFLSLLKSASTLVSRSLAKREIIHTVLAAMRAAKIEPDYATINVLVDFISREAQLNRARAEDVFWLLSVADTTGEQAVAEHSGALAPRVWVPLMKVLVAAAKHGHASGRDAMELVERTQEFFAQRGGRPSVYFYNSAMLVLVNEQRFLFDNLPPSMRVGKACEAGLPGRTGRTGTQIHCGSGVTPWKLLRVMDEVGEAPDLVTFNTALSFYVPSAVGVGREVARREGLATTMDMRRRGITPEVSTYNILIQIIAFSTLDGAPADDAAALAFSASQARSRSFQAPSSAPESSNVEHAAAALTAVDEMMIRMRKDGLTPDAMTYDALVNVAIASCGVHGRREGLVKADGQRARQSTRTMLLDAGDVLRWLHEMQGEGVRATKNTVQGISSLLPVLGASGGVSGPQARDILSRLIDLGGEPSVQSYNLFITTIARACRHRIGTLTDAGVVLRSMEERRVSLNCFTFNALFDVLGATGHTLH